MTTEFEPAERIEAPIVTEKGVLCFVEGEKDIPFAIKRVFFITDVSEGAVRGNHAMKTMREVVFCIKGSVIITLNDGQTTEDVHLEKPNEGLLIEPNQWRILHDFAPDTVLLALVDTSYDPDDYIRDYQEFENTYGLPTEGI